MSRDKNYDILVAGAGPTGMSAAIALHDSGCKVMIVDKHETGLSFSRAILVNSQTLSLLEPFGIAAKIMSRGQPFTSISINGPNGIIINGCITTEHSSSVHPTALPQLATEDCLTEGLSERGIEILRPCTLRSFNQFDNYVESTLEKDGQLFSVQTSYLLGADGFHSVVRDGLGISYNKTNKPLLMYSQDAIIDWSDRPDVMIWILDTGAAIGIKIRNDMVRFAATNKETFYKLPFKDQIKTTTGESKFDVYFAQVNTYGDRRVWIAGDAAHVHSPVGGRGMNMGIADGIRFAQALSVNDLKGYQQDRHAVSSDWVKKNKLFTEIMSDKSFKGHAGRLGIRMLLKIVASLSGENAGKKLFEAIAVG